MRKRTSDVALGEDGDVEASGAKVGVEVGGSRKKVAKKGANDDAGEASRRLKGKAAAVEAVEAVEDDDEVEFVEPVAPKARQAGAQAKKAGSKASSSKAAVKPPIAKAVPLDSKTSKGGPSAKTPPSAQSDSTRETRSKAKAKAKKAKAKKASPATVDDEEQEDAGGEGESEDEQADEVVLVETFVSVSVYICGMRKQC